MKVRIPNNQLVQEEITENNLGEQTYNASTRTVTIDSLQGSHLDDLPLLGQTFLTSTYLFVEPDRNSFTIWQASPMSNQDVIPQVDAGSSSCTTARPSTTIVQQTSNPTPSSTNIGNGITGKSSSHAGAIVGGVVGGIAAVFVMAGIAFFLLRRRRRRSGSDGAVIASTTHEKSSNRYSNRSLMTSLNEIGGSQGLRRELGGEEFRLELEQEGVRRELEGSGAERHDGGRFELL